MKDRYKISNYRASISEEELESFKDFDKILSKSKAQLHTKYKSINRFKRLSKGVLVLTILISTLYLIDVSRDDGNSRLIEVNEPSLGSEPKTTFTNIDSVETSKPMLIEDETNNTVAKEKNEIVNVKPLKEQKKNTQDSAEGASQIDYQYIEAQPTDGLPSLYQYFDRELKYPYKAIVDSVSGSVFIQFTIDTVGNPKNVTVEQSLGILFDQEAMRLIENMPPWQPATINGKPIESKIRIPIHFSIKENMQ